MPAYTLAPAERDPARFVQAIRQLGQGRSDATGTVTLTVGGTTTKVFAPTCGPGCAVFLSAQTAAAATILPNTHIDPLSVGSRQFTITHSSAPAGCTFWFLCIG